MLSLKQPKRGCLFSSGPLWLSLPFVPGDNKQFEVVRYLRSLTSLQFPAAETNGSMFVKIEGMRVMYLAQGCISAFVVPSQLEWWTTRDSQTREVVLLLASTNGNGEHTTTRGILY